MHEILTLVLRQLRDTWRFRWYALGIAWLVAIGGWLYVYSLPNQYQVSARVHIDTKSAIHPLLNGMAVAPNVDDKVSLLIRTILSRPNLKEIVRRTNLGLKTTTPQAEDAMVEALRKRIHIRNEGGHINLYRIRFSSSDPKTARTVVQQVINIMTSMALGDEDKSSSKARKFLNAEVEDYRGRLDKLERKRTEFKQQHAGMILTSEDYSDRLNSLQSSVDDLTDQLGFAQDKRADLQQRLSASQSGGTRRVAPENSRQVRSIDARIAKRQNKLQQMLTRYTPQHPDVVALKKQIERLKKNRRDTVAELKKHPERVAVASSGGSGRLRGELDDAKNQIATLQTKIERKSEQLDKLKNNSDAMSDAQIKLARINRNYNATKSQYNKLLTRLYSARLSTDVNKIGNRLKFNLIDPPETPTEPTGPKRTLLLTMAFAVSLAAGAAFAFFLSQIRPVFINRRALTDFTGLPVLGSVSMAWSRQQVLRRQTALLLFFGGVATLALCYFGAVAFAPAATRMVPTLLTNQWL